jgi:hypothetical protein
MSSDSDSFTLTLMSNGCMKTQPTNTPTEFVNDSYEEIHLDGDWEMYPVEITFEKNWYNFLERDYLICVFYPSISSSETFDGGDRRKTNGCLLSQSVVDGIESRQRDETFSFRMMELPKSYYSNVQRLTDYINSTMEELLSDAKQPPKVKFAFDEVFDRVRLLAPRDVLMMTVGSYLQTILGFDDKTITTVKYEDGTFPTRLNLMRDQARNATLSPSLDDITVIYIYCDIVEYQLVADTRLPLIGIVVIDKNLPYGSMVRYVWKMTQPMKVVTNNIRNIRIKLATPQGKPIPFTRGSTNLVLRFRRRGFL